MIESLRVMTQNDDRRVAYAKRIVEEEEYDYQLEFAFVNQTRIENKVILRHQKDNRDMTSYAFQLPRGLFDVYVVRIRSINGRNVELYEETRQKYPKPIMIGNKYDIIYQMKPYEAYDQYGVALQFKSTEMPVTSHTVYYCINKEGIDQIKYYIPFTNNNQSVRFFIKGVELSDISLGITDPSFQLIER